MDRLAVARSRCVDWHAGQLRKYTGEPYHVHPFEVARILRGVGASEDLQIAGLLHDVIEDCGVTAMQLEAQFGPRVAALVQMVTDVSKPEDGNRAVRKALDRAHLAKADPAGQTLKLADLISNTSSIVIHDPAFAKIYMKEKLDLLLVLGDGHIDLWRQASGLVHQYFIHNSLRRVG